MKTWLEIIKDNGLIEIDGFVDKNFVEQLCENSSKQSFQESEYFKVSTYDNWELGLQKNVNSLKLRLSTCFKVNIERVGEFNLIQVTNNNFLTKLPCTKDISEFTVILPFYLENKEGTLVLEQNENTNGVVVRSGKLIVVNNLQEDKSCFDKLNCTFNSNLFLLVGYIRTSNFNSRVLEPTNKTVELNRNLLLQSKYPQNTEYTKESMIGLLSSLYSVCSCRVKKLNRRSFSIDSNKSKEWLYYENKQNTILSLHIVVITGSCEILLKHGDSRKLEERDILSLYNVNDIESFISKFYFLNLEKETKIDVYGLHLNKID